MGQEIPILPIEMCMWECGVQSNDDRNILHKNREDNPLYEMATNYEC